MEIFTSLIQPIKYLTNQGMEAYISSISGRRKSMITHNVAIDFYFGFLERFLP
jgi:hypothetical protein